MILFAAIVASVFLYTPTSAYMLSTQSKRMMIHSFVKLRREPALQLILTSSIKQRNSMEVRMYSASTVSPEESEKVKPKELLRKYGPAYLVTSIFLAIISYALCYLLVSTGVDVVSLLEKLGIKSSVAAANTGTAAIAYAVHKAASPIRFPPTVALTPVVARWFGRKPVEEKK